MSTESVWIWRNTKDHCFIERPSAELDGAAKPVFSQILLSHMSLS